MYQYANNCISVLQTSLMLLRGYVDEGQENTAQQLQNWKILLLYNIKRNKKSLQAFKHLLNKR